MKIDLLPPGLLVFIQVAVLSRTITALAVNARSPHIFLARDTCAGREGLSTCGQALPDNFCCSTGDTCIRLNNTGAQAAALCCPKDRSCDEINIITCNTSFQDPNQFPEMPLHLSDTSIALATCGNGCCPLGYECQGDGASCRIKDDTKASETVSATTTMVSSTTTSEPASTSSSGPNESTVTTSLTSTSTSTPTLASASATATGTSSPVTIEPKETESVNTAGLIMAGLFPGLLAGCVITLGIHFYLKKRRQQKRGYKSDNGSSFFGPPTPHDVKAPKISEPIYRPGMSDRVVFGHGRTASGKTLPALPLAGGSYKPTNDDRRTVDLETLVSPPSSSGHGKKVRTLDPPFETPTKPQRSAKRDHEQTRSFFSRSSSRSSRRNTQETITMTMSPPRVPSSYQQGIETPQVRQTTYSDVYRAAGVSPSQIRSMRPIEDVRR